MRFTLAMLMAVPAMASFAQAAEGNGNFAQQQAYAEMQRVTGQIDVLQNNFDSLAERVGRLESGNGSSEVKALRTEVTALRNELATLRTELANQRGAIVKDLSSRIAKLQPPPAEKKVERPAAPVGPSYAYTVRAGDTLSLIAKAFNTTVPKIREMNNLKGDGLRVGQQLNVPKE